jgi:plasmid stabilization system protein ParE
MRIVFDDEALTDLEGIRRWIAQRNARAANDLVKKIFERAESLLAPGLTYMGRPGLDLRNS